MLKVLFIKITKLVVPPIFFNLAKKLFISISRENNEIVKPSPLINFTGRDFGGGLVDYVDTMKVDLNIPVKSMRFHGGLGFNSCQHPFLFYLDGGFSDFERFYRSFQPNNIFERHFIYNENECTHDIFLPWIYPLDASEHHLRNEPGGLSRSHDGVIIHGPCSMKKLRFETRRLDHLLSSVKKNGFQTSSKPDGYLLENSAGDRVFHVMDGNHRVAVVSYMETSDYLVPVRMRVGFPRVVRENDVKRWPAVQMGVLSEEKALRIFNAYFRTTRQSVYDLISRHLEKPTRL